MKKLLTALYDTFYQPPRLPELQQKVDDCRQQRHETLDISSRRLVLRIVDAKDEMADIISVDSFICGFQLAWQMAEELRNYGCDAFEYDESGDQSD